MLLLLLLLLLLLYNGINSDSTITLNTTVHYCTWYSKVIFLVLLLSFLVGRGIYDQRSPRHRHRNSPPTCMLYTPSTCNMRSFIMFSCSFSQHLKYMTEDDISLPYMTTILLPPLSTTGSDGSQQ